MSRVEIEYYNFRCFGLVPVEDQQWISFGQTGITPILTPGHTAGGLCFRIENNLFTGDTLFAEGCGICMDRGADPVAMYDSLQRLKSIIPPQTLVYPGHSYGTPPGQSFKHILANNVYLHFDKVQDFVAYRMRKGQTGWLRFK
jgi:hydroxyacylglutathione hydrolase